VRKSNEHENNKGGRGTNVLGAKGSSGQSGEFTIDRDRLKLVSAKKMCIAGDRKKDRVKPGVGNDRDQKRRGVLA